MGQEKNFVLTERARSEDQKKVLEEITASGICPFCSEGLARWHKNKTIAENDHWILTTAMWAYPNTKHHFLMISKKHASHLSRLPVEAGASMWELMSVLEQRYEITSGAVFMRFGNPQHNGGSVDHLHTHLIVPDFDQDWETIKVKLGSR